MLSSREHGDDSSHGTLTSVKTTLMQEWDGTTEILIYTYLHCIQSYFLSLFLYFSLFYFPMMNINFNEYPHTYA